jgi:hypothetical protein
MHKRLVTNNLLKFNITRYGFETNVRYTPVYQRTLYDCYVFLANNLLHTRFIVDLPDMVNTMKRLFNA